MPINALQVFFAFQELIESHSRILGFEKARVHEVLFHREFFRFVYRKMKGHFERELCRDLSSPMYKWAVQILKQNCIDCFPYPYK